MPYDPSDSTSDEMSSFAVGGPADFIQTKMSDTDFLKNRISQSSSFHRLLSFKSPETQESPESPPISPETGKAAIPIIPENLEEESKTPVFDITNCIMDIRTAQPYIKGDFLGIKNKSFNQVQGEGFCAMDLKKLKLIHHTKETESDSYFDESGANLHPWTMTDHREGSQKVPEFRYSDRPSLVLLILRKGTPDVLDCAIRRICHLRDHWGVNVLIEPTVYDRIKELMITKQAADAIKDNKFSLAEGLDITQFLSMEGIVTWKSDFHLPKLTPFINFGIVLGGDGTVLWTSLLFPKRVPPLLCVAMGSLGYLASTRPEDCQKRVEALVKGQRFKADLRCRLEAYITDLEGNPVRLKEFKAQTGGLAETKGVCHAEDDVLFMTVLNDIVISKESFGQLSTLDCSMNGEYFTTCTADGLIVATPTGSTAYSMSAGGSIVHPDVPAMLFTPICPHSLSFRPLVLPDSVILSIKNPIDNRSRKPMVISRDGFTDDDLKLPPGYSVHIRVSSHPLSLITVEDGSSLSSGGRWLSSLNDRLKWNYRKRQNGKVL